LGHFLGWVREQIGDRDPLDTEQAKDEELGGVLKLTLPLKMAIETRATKFKREKGWLDPDGRPYRITTIAVVDMSPAEVAKAYRQQRNHALAERRKADRNRRLAMQPTTQSGATSTYRTYAEMMAAKRAATKAQADAIWEAIADSERTVDQLIELVRDHPSWRNVTKAKLRRTVLDRLDLLKEQKRIHDRPEKGGRRGRLLRVVWRV
jgi:hypothetical protein